MGWRAIYKDLRFVKEEDGIPRPVKDGQEDQLCVIAEESYGHSVAVDLVNGIIAVDYDHLAVQNGTIEVTAKALLWICEETNLVAEFSDLKQELEPWYRCPEDDDPGSSNKDETCANGHARQAVLHEDGTPVHVRTDILIPLVWRPIWFIRHTLPGGDCKVIGAQVTLPESQGSRNIKKLVTIFEDGRIGID